MRKKGSKVPHETAGGELTHGKAVCGSWAPHCDGTRDDSKHPDEMQRYERKDNGLWS